MSEPITPGIIPVPWFALDERDETLSQDLLAILDTALDRFVTGAYDLPADRTQAEAGGAATLRDHHLARMSAAYILSLHLNEVITDAATAAGAVEGAPATYTALGAAVGIGREGARSRFPGAVPGAKPGRPRDARPRWERYVDAVGLAVRAAGVHTTLTWAETNGVDDERQERWEGGVSCGTDTLAWNEDDGWWVILGSESVRDLPVAVDAPVKEVVAAALKYLTVLVDRRPGELAAGDRLRDADMVWEVTDTPLTLPDGTVVIPVRDTADPEHARQFSMDPEVIIHIEG
ncbi:hypothetical protein [Streptomyces sp. NPDC000931]|uniref:hypothetical protein n=1 Tax=Streptomyces sp. NPDC000931 TaxID=3154372 RepID=UPI00331F6A98